MRILALTHRSPFPPDRGDRIRSYHLLRRLGQKHEIWLCSIEDTAADQTVHNALDEFTHRHEVFVQSPAARYEGALRSLCLREPLTLGWFRNRAAHKTLARWSAETKFDVAFVYSSSMAPYWLELNEHARLPAVMDFIDVDSAKWAQYARHGRVPGRWIHSREAKTLARFEREVAAAAARNVFVSEAEVQTFRDIAPGARVEALSSGVDGEGLALPELVRRADPPSLIFVGMMDYQPNVDAVRWFADEVLPRVRVRHPNVTFDIVGARPAPSVKALREREGIRVTGWVEDIRPYLWKATVAVAPLRIAQGTQTKVLEAMAASIPVVSTSLAARGIERPRGDHIRVADTPDGFAEQVNLLLSDPTAARRQAQAALKMVREHHSWETAVSRLEQMLEAAANGRSS